MSDLYIGAYWGPRRESDVQCAHRMTTCLQRLRNCDEVFSQWFQKATSRSNALTLPIDIGPQDAALSLFKSGRNRRDNDQTPIEDLGFRVSLWNGHKSTRSSAMSVACGIYADNQHLRNSVVLDLPDELANASGKDRCLAILTAVVDAWEPDWAGVISRTSRNSRSPNPASPFVDWMVYINRPGINYSSLPSAATTSNIGGRRVVVVVQDRPINPASQADVENADAVATLLGVNQ